MMNSSNSRAAASSWMRQRISKSERSNLTLIGLQESQQTQLEPPNAFLSRNTPKAYSIKPSSCLWMTNEKVIAKVSNPNAGLPQYITLVSELWPDKALSSMRDTTVARLHLTK